MPSLRELQRDFAHALIAGDEGAALEHIVAPRALDAAGALDIYRNNVRSNYRNALRDDYPALLALVGDDFFHAACDAYVRAHPSPSGDLNAFGAAFASFLEGWPPAAELPYLPDVGRLEWAIQTAFNAADASALDLTRLADLAPEAIPELRFDLHPSAVLLHSRFPIFAIWRTSTSADTREVDLSEGAAHVLVIRRSDGVQIEPIPAGDLAALYRLSSGATIRAANEHALSVDPAFDLSAFLQRHVLSGTIVGFDGPVPTRAA